MTYLLRLLTIAAVAKLASAHGSHGHKESSEDDSSWSGQGYAAEHMHKEHHIDSFDLASFFQLHDLDGNGYWDAAEIEAVYGMHHEYAKKLSKTEQEQKEKAEAIVKAVLAKMDTNGDGLVSQAEFEKAGFDGLESFKEMGAEGHHYDVESEFFLHHEEEFHSTPETQTEDSYVHAEDIEHFEKHAKIELEEINKERAYQGLPPVRNLAQADAERERAQREYAASHPPEEDEEQTSVEGEVEGEGEGEGKADESPEAGEYETPGAIEDPPRARQTVVRQVPPEKQDPAVRYKDAGSEAKEKPQWGEGDDGYKRPKSAADKLRKNVPYKYKFRKNWGDF